MHLNLHNAYLKRLHLIVHVAKIRQASRLA